MSLIDVKNLTFYYEGSSDNVFENVSFQIDTDWKLGFIARNGRGKTTFLNLLLGKYEYLGKIVSSERFEYFPYECTDKGKNTIDVLEELNPDYEFWKVCRELTLLQMSDDIWDRPFETLSHGEQTKVMLAVLFSKENQFLLIDEPTNHLDMNTRAAVSDYLNQKKGFIVVSHDRNFLDGCIDHVLSINRTNIEVVQGNFTSWWENKKLWDEYERNENIRLQKDIRRLKESARRTEKWAIEVESTKIGKKSEKYEKNIDTRAYVGEKSRRMQQRRKNLERRQEKEIEEKSSLLKNVEEAENLKLLPLRFHKEVLIAASHLSLQYGSKTVCEDVNFTVRNGECIILQGANGCGKSTILKKIVGEIAENTICQQGELMLHGALQISYVSQDTSYLSGTLSDFIAAHQIDESIFKQFLRKMDFSRELFSGRMENYSEGQKKKVLLAKSMCDRAHLYIWDEPLNFIDVFSRMQIEELIKAYRPAMLLVEHDRTFVNTVATKVINLGGETKA